MGNNSSSDSSNSRRQNESQLIQRQQETIRKQQLLIEQQQARVGNVHPNRVQAHAAPTTTVQHQNSSSMHPGTCAEYKCPLCNGYWRSNVFEHRLCKKCHIKVYPSVIPENKPRPGAAKNPSSDKTKLNNLNKPDAMKKMVNKKWRHNQIERRLVLDFKCPTCNTAWTTTYYGSSQQCNKCKSDVLPLNLKDCPMNP